MWTLLGASCRPYRAIDTSKDGVCRWFDQLKPSLKGNEFVSVARSAQGVHASASAYAKVRALWWSDRNGYVLHCQIARTPHFPKVPRRRGNPPGSSTAKAVRMVISLRRQSDERNLYRSTSKGVCDYWQPSP